MQANPPQLHSNLLYIQRYRRQSRLVAEAAYFFTNMLSAESFIMNIDAKSISMDETEFEKNMESAQALLSGLSADSSEDIPSQSTTIQRSESIEPNKQENSIPKRRNKSPSSSISDLENKGASMIIKEGKAERVFRDFPYLYSQAGDLTVSDVEELLNNYKQLVFKYVCLSKGTGVAAPSPPFSTQHGGENVKEMQGNQSGELTNEAEMDSDGVPPFGGKFSETDSAQDVAAESQGAGNDEKILER